MYRCFTGSEGRHIIHPSFQREKRRWVTVENNSSFLDTVNVSLVPLMEQSLKDVFVTASSALSNFTEHDFQFVITFSDLESLQRILSNISFPIAINNTVEITSIETTTGRTRLGVLIFWQTLLLCISSYSGNIIKPLYCADGFSYLTTVCSPNITGYQCVCEENFAWSYNNCITYGVCDAIAGDTCGCINGLPADGQFCQSNSSQTGRPEKTSIQQLVEQQFYSSFTLN